MAYLETKEPMQANSGKCPECLSKCTIYSRGILSCTNCGNIIVGNKSSRRKHKSIKSVSDDGYKHDSYFERTVGDELQQQVIAGNIKDYDTSFTVEIPIYSKHGEILFSVKHKVDYRIHHNDGSFELYEVKGRESDDWKWRSRLLDKVWRFEHPDHEYTVRKAKFSRRER